LEERHELDLDKVVDALARIQGVVGVFLFGSFARGDYDAFSDYDLLVLFEDKAKMWRNWDELFQAVGGLRMNLHVIPETLEELKAANPVFLEELFKHGKVLFARFPLEVFFKPVKLELFCLIIYDMSGLSYKDKMKVVYFLYRKGNSGAIAGVGGIKLSEGCLLVPKKVGDDIINTLKALGVNVKKLEIYVGEDYFESLFGQRSIGEPKKPPS
jgi:predicted nucleotidyltransferase